MCSVSACKPAWEHAVCIEYSTLNLFHSSEYIISSPSCFSGAFLCLVFYLAQFSMCCACDRCSGVCRPIYAVRPLNNLPNSIFNK